MHNLVSGLPRRHRRAMRIARVQGVVLVLLVILAAWPLTHAQPPEGKNNALSSSTPRANRLPPQPWQQHLHLWQQLGAQQHVQLQVTQLDYNQQHWVFYLQATDLHQLGPWLQAMRQATGLRMQLRRTEPQQESYRIIVEGRLEGRRL